MVYSPDDPELHACPAAVPARPSRDPWKLKHALADLDAALGKRGEMIGALLIVGSDAVVPFHRLPNPTDDMDGEVLSDSPYATLDANYFVPEWPVGRLPGESGPDAWLLLEQLRQMHRYPHAPQAVMPAWPGMVVCCCAGCFGSLLPSAKSRRALATPPRSGAAHRWRSFVPLARRIPSSLAPGIPAALKRANRRVQPGLLQPARPGRQPVLVRSA